MKCIDCKHWKQDGDVWEDWKAKAMKEGFVFGSCVAECALLHRIQGFKQ